MIEPNEGQKKAVEEILAWARDKNKSAMALSGYAGTGKTTTMELLKPKLARMFPTVMLTATTGKAALRLKEVVREPTTTLHKALYAPPGEESQRPTFSFLNGAPKEALLVIDEASMIAPEIWTDLVKWMDKGVKVLLVGDSFQLPPVTREKDEDFSIFAQVAGPCLTQVMRNDSAVLRAATVLREEGRILTEASPGYFWGRKSADTVVDEFLADEEGHALVTWRNAVRMGLNHQIREKKGRASELPEDGEPILIRRNSQGYLNGEVVKCAGITPGKWLGPVPTKWLAIADDDGNTRTILCSTFGEKQPMDGGTRMIGADAWKEYIRAKRDWEDEVNSEMDRKRRWRAPDPCPITWGYVHTCHSAQGSECRRVTVYLPEADTSMKPFKKASKLPNGKTVPFFQRFIYTALTRAKEHASLVFG